MDFILYKLEIKLNVKDVYYLLKGHFTGIQMIIFKNHYSAVFVFILTGLFFLPANGNSDVVVDPSMSNAPMSGDTSGTLPTVDNSAAPINEGRDMDVGSHRAAPIGDAEESGGPAAQHMNREINDGGFGANSGAGDDKARIAAEAQAAEQAAQAEAARLAKEEAYRLAAKEEDAQNSCKVTLNEIYVRTLRNCNSEPELVDSILGGVCFLTKID